LGKEGGGSRKIRKKEDKRNLELGRKPPKRKFKKRINNERKEPANRVRSGGLTPQKRKPRPRKGTGTRGKTAQRKIEQDVALRLELVGKPPKKKNLGRKRGEKCQNPKKRTGDTVRKSMSKVLTAKKKTYQQKKRKIPKRHPRKGSGKSFTREGEPGDKRESREKGRYLAFLLVIPWEKFNKKKKDDGKEGKTIRKTE